MIGQTHFGDVMEVLPRLAVAGLKVQMCVTSPPYWGLRCYGHDKQLGMEKLHDCLGWATGQKCGECFICHMVTVFRHVRDLLNDDGVCWLNIGDSYAASRSYQVSDNKNPAVGVQRNLAQARPAPGLKPKDMVLIPQRLALALQADGWWVRRDVIWFKKNPMPESTKDRPTTSHEYIWLLAKNELYYFDAVAIMEEASEDSHARYARGRSDKHKYADGGPGGQTIARSFDHMVNAKPVSGWNYGEGSHKAADHNVGVGAGKRQRKGAPNGVVSGVHPKAAPADSGIKANESFCAAVKDVVTMRNSRSVWPMASEPYSEAHFATFPTLLAERCIAAGSRPGDVVLDPFMGSGTTAECAERLGRRWDRLRAHAAQAGGAAGAGAVKQNKLQKLITDALVDSQSDEAGWPRPKREFRFAPPRQWKLDYFWDTGERMALEVEGGVWTGGRHVHPQGFMRDLEKYNELAIHGIRLIRLTPEQLNRGELKTLLERVLG